MSSICNPIPGGGGGGGGGETLDQTLILGDLTGASSGIYFSAGDGANFASNSELAFSSTVNPFGAQDIFINRQSAGTIGIGAAAGDALGTLNVHHTVITGSAQHKDNVYSLYGSASDSLFLWSTNQATANNHVLAMRAAGDVTAGGALIITEKDNWNKDHHLATSSDISLVLFHGGTDVDSDATKYMRMYHDGSSAVFSEGGTKAFEILSNGETSFVGLIRAQLGLKIFDDDFLFLGDGGDAAFNWNKTQATAHNLVLGIGADGTSAQGGALIITELANQSKDHHHAVSSDVSLILHHGGTDVDVDATQYMKMYHDGTQGRLNVEGTDVLDLQLGLINCNVQLRPNSGVRLANSTTFQWISGPQLTYNGSYNQMLWAMGTSRHVVFGDDAFIAFDYDHAMPDNPTIFIHSSGNPSTDNTEWMSLAHSGGNAIIGLGKGNLVIDAPVVVPNGSIGACAIQSPTDAGDGIYFPDTNSMAIAINGALACNFKSSSVTFGKSTVTTDMLYSLWGTGSDAGIRWDTGQTNDGLSMFFGSTSNYMQIIDLTHTAVDYGHTNQSHPTLFMHGNTATTTNWLSLGFTTKGILNSNAGGLDLATAGLSRINISNAGQISVQGDIFVNPSREFGKLTTGFGAVQTYDASEVLDVSSSEVTTGLIPAGAYDVAILCRNTSTITGTTAVSYDVGVDGGDTDAGGTALPFTDANTTSSADWTAGPLAWSASAREIRVTPDAGTLDTGTIRISVIYKLATAMSTDS